MVLALKDQWIWDFWLAREQGNWHVYFLKADKALGDPHLRHRHATIGHATSTNLIDWNYLGTCFKPRTHAGFDDWTTWTGSLIKDKMGIWHLFYTGTTHGDGGLKQRIGHATSTDMHNWSRVSANATLDISGPDYEDYTPGHWHDRAMRDPHVIRDPEGEGYLMFFTARVPNIVESNAGGSIGFATSPDLYTWTLQPPVFKGGLFGQMEVPQVTRIGENWYCLFCTDARHYSASYANTYPGTPVSGTHYLMAAHPRGPWQVAPGPFLDGDVPTRRYAGKLVMVEKTLKYLAFIHDGPNGEFVGELSDPMDVRVDEKGLLHLAPNLTIHKAI